MRTLELSGVNAPVIGRWDMSNFDVDDLQELASPACATNQVLYNLEERGVEFDLLLWCQQHHQPLMAYCPMGQDGVIAIPKAVRPEHVQLNAQAARLRLEAGDLEALDRAFHAPQRKQRLAMV